MRVWVVLECVKWEGDTVIGVLSDEGLDKYLIDHPAFKREEGEEVSYSTYTPKSYDWYDIRAWQVDTDGVSK